MKEQWSVLAPLSTKLVALETQATQGWPAESIALLQGEGCFRSAIDARFGGEGLGAVEQLAMYHEIAAGSLSLALILTQHDGACQFLQSSENEAHAEPILSSLAEGQGIATIGISQLTTSHQDGPPALMAREATASDSGDKGYILNGTIPWMTSAAHAAWMVIGAACGSSGQLLGCLPGDTPGLEVVPPQPLMALNESYTSQVHCHEAPVAPETILRGPAKDVLRRRSPVKSLTVSAVGLGVAQRLLVHSLDLANSPELTAIVEHASREYLQLHARLRSAATNGLQDKSLTSALRADINVHLARLSATILTLAKGSGYANTHPIQRDLREALFFLVWSAPSSLRAATVQRLWGLDGAPKG